jgi:hypothetical protein
MEELDCAVQVCGHFLTKTYEYPDSIVTLSVWFCRMISDFRLKEHEEFLWIAIDDLDSSDWAPADTVFLEELKSRFSKPYALVTGATGVLGKEFALTLASRGENLFLTGRSGQALQELQAKINEKFPDVSVLYQPCDLTSEEDRANLFACAEGLQFSRLVNVAGADIQKPFAEYDQQKIIFQTRVCFEAAVCLCHFAIAHAAKPLKILNISSVSGIYPMPYFAIYAATKGALTQFSLALRHEVKGQNIAVTAVLSGAIYTRPDVVDYIKTQGVWGKIAAKNPAYVVQKSLLASQKNRGKVILGFANKCMNFFTHLIPPCLRMRYIAKKWSKTRKDAF